MNILFLADDFPPKSFGGAGIIAHSLACGLAKAGHDISVITTVQDKKEEGKLSLDGLTIYRIYVDYPNKLEAYVSLHNRRAIKKVEAFFKEVKPEVIHAHNIHHYLSYYCLKVARKFTEKVFLTTHDAMAFNYGKLARYYDFHDLSVQKNFSYKVSFIDNLRTARFSYNPFRNFYIRYMINTYPKMIFPITDLLKDALAENGIGTTHVPARTIHYGIDISGWNVSESEKESFRQHLKIATSDKVVFLGGRLSEAKGGRLTIETLAHVLKKEPHARLLLAGLPNAYTESLLKRAEELKIRERISFTGWLSREEIKKAYAVSSVVVTPSIYFDAFNLFNIEAGAASRPVVGTCFGGTPEIIRDKETGIIVNPRNTVMYANALVMLLADPAYAKTLGENNRRRVEEHFTMARYVAETLDCYQAK